MGAAGRLRFRVQSATEAEDDPAVAAAHIAARPNK